MNFCSECIIYIHILFVYVYIYIVISGLSRNVGGRTIVACQGDPRYVSS